MIGVIFILTLRQVLSRRSTLLLLAFALLPVLLALIFRLANEDADPERWTARVLLNGLVVRAMLPLTALFRGTAVLGNELEDGTAVYLLTKPVPRWQILAAKLAVAALYTAAFVLGATVAAGSLALSGQGSASIVAGFGLAVVVGALAYTTLFVLLSVLTSRALIAGLVYVFLWEGAITSIFSGLRFLSVRHYCLSIAEAIADTPPNTFGDTLGGGVAVVLAAVAVAGGALLANRRLSEIEVREQT